MSPVTYTKEDVLGYECRHVTYCDPRDWSIPDMHFVKEIVHLKDGRKIPRNRKIPNYQRPYWITRPGVQKLHKQKKEREKQENLIRYECTQRDLVSRIAKSLGQPGFKGSLKQICRSPYVYGADILSTAIIKKEYQTRFKNLETPYSVCALDIESDMIQGHRRILMCTIAMAEKVYTVIDRNYFQGYVDVDEERNRILREKMQLYLGDIVEKRKMDWEIAYVDTPAKVVVKTFEKLHQWQPDILAIWNMDFDIPKMATELDNEGYYVPDVFCDPSVPKPYRFFKYVQGQPTKVTANNTITPVPPEDRWHTASFPASFYVIDAMCAYRGIRNQKPRAGSYSLDSILNKEIKRGKLKFAQADHVRGGDWHTFMQSEYPFEYVIYNVFDVVGMLELDEKTKDLSAALPKSAKHSDFRNFRQQPRRLVNDFHYTCLQNGYVFATTSDQMKTELDQYVISTEDWIIALPAFMIAENGLRLPFTELEKQHKWLIASAIFTQVADLDVSAAYPTNEIVANICQETTFRELSTIENVDEPMRRLQGINLTGGATNATEFCINMLGLPDWMTLLKDYESQQRPAISSSTIVVEETKVEDTELELV